MKRSVGDFLGEFVLPFVRGGEAHIARPISVEDVIEYETELPYHSDHSVAVDDARTDVISDIVVRPPALLFDADELHLAAAVHNLLFLTHPSTESWTIGARSERKVLQTALGFARRPLTANRVRVLGRHGLLHNLFDVSRTDIRLSWWAGSATFLGQRPPTRLRRWRSVRRVREDTSVARYEDLFGTPELAPVIATLLRRSPLTRLLAVGRDGPPLNWEEVAFVLRDAELARAVAYRAIRPGEPLTMVAAPARYAVAFEQMLERTPKEPDVRVVTAFLVHLNVLLALAETRTHNVRGKSGLIEAVLSMERAGQRPRGLATFFALPNAMAMVDPRLAEPPGLREEPALVARWTQHRSQVAEGVGDAVIETLAGRLRRHLTGVLESAESRTW